MPAVRQYLRAGVVDEIHLAIAPVLLGSGHLLFGIDAARLGYEVTGHVPTSSSMHVVFAKRN